MGKFCWATIYLLLFAIAIPWYWPWVNGAKPEDPLIAPLSDQGLLFGLPVWFCVSVFASLAISIYTMLLIQFRWNDGHRIED